jgi:hypothetical protein
VLVVLEEWTTNSHPNTSRCCTTHVTAPIPFMQHELGPDGSVVELLRSRVFCAVEHP